MKTKQGVFRVHNIAYNRNIIGKRLDSSVDIQLQEARLFGYPVHLVDYAQAQARVAQALAQQENLHVVTLNPEMIMQDEEALLVNDPVYAAYCQQVRYRMLPGIF